MLQNAFVDVYLFVTLKKGEGEATFSEERERGEFKPMKKVGMFTCLNNFCA